MQIGVGKSGVKIGEYTNKQEGMGTLGWIEPACTNPQWIMWFDSKGDALLYTQRKTGLEPEYHDKTCSYRIAHDKKKDDPQDYSCTCGGPKEKHGGAVIGEPINIKAHGGSVPAAAPKTSGDVFSDSVFQPLLSLSKTVSAFDPKLEVSPSGTLVSAKLLLHRQKKQIRTLKEEIGRLDVQLAGCLGAAEGMRKARELNLFGDWNNKAVCKKNSVV